MFTRLQLARQYGLPITRDDPALHAWFLDMEAVDWIVPPEEAHELVLNSVEVDAITALTVRIRTPHQEN